MPDPGWQISNETRLVLLGLVVDIARVLADPAPPMVTLMRPAAWTELRRLYASLGGDWQNWRPELGSDWRPVLR